MSVDVQRLKKDIEDDVCGILCDILYTQGLNNETNIYGQATIAKTSVTHINGKHLFQSCQQQISLTVDNVLFSEESNFTIFPFPGELQCKEAPKKLPTWFVACPE